MTAAPLPEAGPGAREILETAAGSLLTVLREEFGDFGDEYREIASGYSEQTLGIVRRAASGDLDRDAAAAAIENYWLAARSDLARGMLAFGRRAAARRSDLVVKSLTYVVKALVPLVLA